MGGTFRAVGFGIGGWVQARWSGKMSEEAGPELVSKAEKGFLEREGSSKDGGTRKPTASRIGLGYRLSMETSLVSVQDLRIARSGLRKGPEG